MHTPLKSRLVMWSFYNGLPYPHLGHLQISCCPPTVSQFGWRAILTFQVSPVSNRPRGVGERKERGEIMFTFKHSSILAYIYTLILNLFGHFYYSWGQKAIVEAKQKNFCKYLPLSPFIIGRGHKANGLRASLEVTPVSIGIYRFLHPCWDSEESKSSEDTVPTLWALWLNGRCCCCCC